jgi:integrase
MGCLYRRGKNYWIKYYKNGKPYAESTQSDKLEVAKRLLKKREGEIAQGKLPGVIYDRIKFDELAEDYLVDYRINGKRTVRKAERCVKYLLTEFGGMKAVDVTTSRIKRHVEKRMEAGISNATINRDLSAIKRMFNLAAKCTPPKVSQVPYVPMLKENNVRKGFIEHEDFLALRDVLPEYLKPVLTFAYYTGWRRSEILGLKWKDINIREGVARLEPGETKNDEGRTLYMEDELWDMMKDLYKQRRLDCLYVFQYNGKQISDFRGSWKRACKTIGLPGLLFHDLRRSGVRNMIRAGIPERVAMTISGHKTRSVFDRYNIVSQEDLKEAAKRRQSFSEQQAEQLQNGYNGTKNKKRVVTLKAINP